jgi:hypothetical protein
VDFLFEPRLVHHRNPATDRNVPTRALFAHIEGKGRPHYTRRALESVLVAAAQVVDEHLFDGLVVGFEDVANGVAADKVANFFGEILGVVAGALQRLSHEDDLQAGLVGEVLGILDVAEEDEVAEAIDFGIGAEDVDSLGNIAVGKCHADISKHFFEDGGHAGEVVNVLGIDASSGGLRAVGKAEKQIPDALEANHEFHAGEEFACLGGLDIGDHGGDGAVDFHVEGIEIEFALTQGIQQGIGTCGYAFGGGPGGFFRQSTGLDGAADDMLMRGFSRTTFEKNTFETNGAHKVSLWGQTGARFDWL